MPITLPARVRSSCALVGGLGDAEVGDLDPPVELDEHVARLHVAVHQTRERARPRARRRPGRRCRRPGPTGSGPCRSMRLAQGDALHELHHDVRDAVVLAGVVGGDDVRVGDRGRGHRLAPEPGPQRLVLGEHRVERLHRDRPREQRVLALATPSPCRRGRSRRRAGTDRRGRARGRRIRTTGSTLPVGLARIRGVRAALRGAVALRGVDPADADGAGPGVRADHRADLADLDLVTRDDRARRARGTRRCPAPARGTRTRPAGPSRRRACRRGGRGSCSACAPCPTRPRRRRAPR